MPSVPLVRRLCILAAALLTALGTALLASPARVRADSNTYSGRAYAVGLSGVVLGPVTVPDQLVGDTGALPGSGGTVSAGPGTVSLPSGLGSVTITTEQASGSSGAASATSQVSSVSILPAGTPGGVLSATVLTANTGVNCGGLTRLASSLATLTIAGQTVPINPNPNTTTTVSTPGTGQTIATVTFNPQSFTASTTTAMASAVAVTFPATGTLASVIQGTITISHAESDIVCPTAATATPTPTPTASPTASPAVSVPNTGAGSVQPPPSGRGAGMLGIGVLIVAALGGGLVAWRRAT